MKTSTTSKMHIWVALLTIILMLSSSSNCYSRKISDYFHDARQAELVAAAAKGDTKTIDKLLKDGACIDYKGKENATALLWAMLEPNKKGFDYLLKKGADPNIFMENGWSVMELAAGHKDIWYLEEVIKYNGDVNLIDPKSHYTPLISSITARSFENMKLLIKSGANINYQGESKWTVMMYAAGWNQYETVYFLLQAGADPTIKNDVGKTLASYINDAHIDEKSDGFQWMQKVIELLKTKGIETHYTGYHIYKSDQ